MENLGGRATLTKYSDLEDEDYNPDIPRRGRRHFEYRPSVPQSRILGPLTQEDLDNIQIFYEIPSSVTM